MKHIVLITRYIESVSVGSDSLSYLKLLVLLRKLLLSGGISLKVS